MQRLFHTLQSFSVVYPINRVKNEKNIIILTQRYRRNLIEIYRRYMQVSKYTVNIFLNRITVFSKCSTSIQTHIPIILDTFFETGSHTVVHAGLELFMWPRLVSASWWFYPSPAKCWDYSCAPQGQAHTGHFLRMFWKSSFMTVFARCDQKHSAYCR